MPFLLEGVVLNPKLNIDDGKHPNPEGVKIIAKNLAPYILKEIKKSFLLLKLGVHDHLLIYSRRYSNLLILFGDKINQY